MFFFHTNYVTLSCEKLEYIIIMRKQVEYRYGETIEQSQHPLFEPLFSIRICN